MPPRRTAEFSMPFRPAATAEQVPPRPRLFRSAPQRSDDRFALLVELVVRLLLLVLLGLLGSIGCSPSASSDGSPATEQDRPPTSADRPATSSTTAPSTTTSTTTPRPEQAVQEAYLRARRLFYEIGRRPDPADGRIFGFAARPYADKVRAIYADLRRRGMRLELVNGSPPVATVLDIAIRGSSAGVEACVIDNVRQVLAETGEVVDDTVTSRRTVARLESTTRGWVITELVSKSNTPGANGCPS